jgi:hypothetical protein
MNLEHDRARIRRPFPSTKIALAAFTAGTIWLTASLAWAQPWAAGTVTPQTHQSWTAVACSADGMKVAAGGLYAPPFQDGGYGVPPQIGTAQIYTSSDSGATWNPAHLPNNTWSCVASSGDGTRLVAGATLTPGGVEGLLFSGDGSIYRSSDSGVNWGITSAPSGQWRSLASSADGTKLFAADGGTNAAVYRSLDSGETWVRTSAPAWSWTSLACSANGTRLLAAASTDLTGTFGGGRIYVSTDSGNSWSLTPAPPQDADSFTSIYTSTNFGTTGSQTTSPAP